MFGCTGPLPTLLVSVHILELSVLVCLLPVSGEAKNFHPLLIFWTFVLICLGRAINVYPISWIVNRYDHPQPLHS